MDTVPQITPISDMKLDQSAVLAKADTAPVVLSQRGRPRAVLVSVEYWDAMAKELRKLRAREVAAQRAKEIEADPSILVPFTDEELIKRGVING
ncbi:MAG: type II toxin-antitoxin system Phd/YefM family antitoxin [Caldilineaceae bacterium]|nr:type II toxin-antitoxin system Phd/YefM family antitoxin [Caldilineaceae bacterium]